MTFVAMIAKGVPWTFDMEEMKISKIGEGNPISFYEWRGKTPKGDTIYMQYQIGKTTSGKISYKLHLKLLPEVVQDIGEMVEKGMEEFLSTVPKWTPEMG
jgi:hypothetical protein